MMWGCYYLPGKIRKPKNLLRPPAQAAKYELSEMRKVKIISFKMI